MKISIIFYRIVNGYLGILLKILFSLTIFLITFLAAIIVGYPLWMFATHYTETYNIFVPAIIISLIIAMIIAKTIKTIKKSSRREYSIFLHKKMTHALSIIVRTFLTLILICFLIYVLLNYSLIISILSVPLIIVVIGLTLFIK